jgi:hypothetical protein
MWGGVARLKHHFAGTRKDVPPCEKCSDELKETYQKLLKKYLEEERGVDIEVEEGQSVDNRRRSMMDGFVIRSDKGVCAKRKLKQITMNAMTKSRIPACRAIMRCIYVDGLPLTLVKSPFLKK